MNANRKRKSPVGPLVVLMAAASVIALGTGVAQGQGGTAKPPKNAVSPWVIPTLGDPAFSVAPASLHGFNDTGLLRNATVSNSDCPTFTDPATFGGTVTLNGVQITIPCNLIVQMPANTLPWAKFVNGSGTASDVANNGLELRAVGNMVGTRHIAGLAYASQQSANSGTGVITGFDYANGAMKIANANGGTVTVQINDPVVPGLTDSKGNPTGRFSAGQSPDPRFSADQDNPTIHAATGYPMCIPRTDPRVAGGDDPLCPQANRPLAANTCRNFSQASGRLPTSGELTAPPAGQKYCSQFVMPAPPAAGPTPGPDARQQAPFEIGDYVSYSGTKFQSGGSDYISAHTIEANLGIFTQPGTQPAYTAIGDFGVGTADPSATAANGAAQETQDRIFLETETTDFLTPVDIYYEDQDNTLGTRSRWITPYEMTGENNPAAANFVAPSGGITTQFAGAQPQRARLRATKAPTGLLSQPSRTVRVAQRTLCRPTPLGVTGTTIDQGALDGCFATNETTKTVANGLAAGEYTAPVFEFIFPENVRPGDILVPNDLWHLPFLAHGEYDKNGVQTLGALTPAPW